MSIDKNSPLAEYLGARKVAEGRVTEKQTDGEGKRRVEAILSTTEVDRDGEVVVSDGLDPKTFRRNPVILFAHNGRDIPVARATDIRKGGGRVEATIEFPAQGDDPMSDRVFKAIENRVLNAMSIGLIRKEIREPTKQDRTRWGDELFLVTSRWEMAEASFVPVPANPSALVTAVSKGLLDLEDVKALDLEEDLAAAEKAQDTPEDETPDDPGDPGEKSQDTPGQDPQDTKSQTQPPKVVHRAIVVNGGPAPDTAKHVKLVLQKAQGRLYRE